MKGTGRKKHETRHYKKDDYKHCPTRRTHQIFTQLIREISVVLKDMEHNRIVTPPVLEKMETPWVKISDGHNPKRLALRSVGHILVGPLPRSTC